MSPDRALNEAPLGFLDIETTGLWPARGDRIIEVALIDAGGTRLKWPAEHVTPSRRRPITPKVLMELVAHLEDVIVVGHNVTFDLRFVAAEAERQGLHVGALSFIDTLALSRAYLADEIDDFRLAALADHLQVEMPQQVHRALPDAELARAVFCALHRRFDLETLADAGWRRLAV